MSQDSSHVPVEGSGCWGWPGRAGYSCKTSNFGGCDSPKPGGPLTTRQPAEYKWRSGYPTPL